LAGKLSQWPLFKRFAAPVLLLAGLTVIGTVGYVVITNGFSRLKALYMKVITAGTVGFGEIKPLHAAGKLFTIFLITTSLALVAFYTTMIARLLPDGEWPQQYRLYRQGKKRMCMENHVMMCGCSRNGRQAGKVLRQNSIPFTVVEQRQHLVA
jgi:voltage-gated potassium channel